MSPLLIKLVNLCFIAFALPLQGSPGLAISPSPGTQIPADNPSSEPQPSDGTISSSPTSVPNAPPPLALAPALPPPVSQANVPVVPPISLPVAQAPPPEDVQVQAPLAPPIASRSRDLIAPAPSRFISPPLHPVTPEASPPSNDQGSSSGPISEPIFPVPILSPPAPAPESLPFIRPTVPGHANTPSVSPPAMTKKKNKGMPVSSPIPANNGSSVAPSPSNSFPKSPVNVHHPPARSPLISPTKHFHTPNKTTNTAPGPSFPVYPPSPKPQGPTIPSSPLRKPKHSHYAPPPRLPRIPGSPVSPSNAPYTRPFSHVSPAPAPSKKSHIRKNFPAKPPSESPKISVVPPLRAFPPPPPNEDCSAIVCTEPFTNTPPGSPCGCVLPIQVGLRLSVALFTFFPLVSELALEISEGVFVKQSQVRIIGANAANQEPDKTVVLVDLVPLGERFDNTTAFLTYQRFWNKKITIQDSYFGDYEVLYVRYPGLPQSPPSTIGINDYGPYPGTNSDARKIKPLGVDVPKRHRKNGLSDGVIAIIVVSSTLAVVLCSAAAWIFVYKRRGEASQPKPTPHVLLRPSISKPSGVHGPMLGSRNSSASLSFGSSIATYTGSAKTFSIGEIEKATDHFNEEKVLGEGGFGRVYRAVLEDGTEAAVKVLKRDDHQGGREFLAEVEMLSRLHHRNLVKLIGICTEERARCLVYELIPNGSVESHLHGIDKESAPLDWGARTKIALGAARGLAYLHEDSSPRVIHRDFKSSNILLEHDFTPKVSDFGLARTALDEENHHISTRVMGTFGYVAPEYAMTGHLLVKSDVYSYGVVLLELLTGRKPVDMSQPAGEENLVSRARPFLSSREGLATIVDQSLGSGSDLPLDNVAKVAAIASMCVQPEVSNRPFMGEVVQALKLVCNEIEAAKELHSRVSSQDDLSIDGDESEEFTDPQTQYSVHSYESDLDIERGISTSELFSSSARLGTEQSESFRRHSSSGPLESRRSERLWGRVRRLSSGGVSEHGSAFRLWPGSR